MEYLCSVNIFHKEASITFIGALKSEMGLPVPNMILVMEGALLRLASVKGMAGYLYAHLL